MNVSDAVFVIHDKYGLSSAGNHTLPLAFLLFGLSVLAHAQRKQNCERASMTWLALGGDAATHALHDTVDRGKPQTGAIALFLGCEIGFEDVPECLGVHAVARIANAKAGVAPWDEFV